MLWVLFALISAIGAGIESILHRVVMLDECPYAYAVIVHFFTAILFVPLLVKEFVFPHSWFAWFLVLLSSILWAIIALTGFSAYKLTNVSIKAPLSEVRIVFLFLLSVLILGEAFYFRKAAGMLLILLGIIILTYKKRKVFGNLKDRGVQLTLLTALVISGVALIDKYAMNYFTAGTFGFLVYFFPGVLLLFFIRRRKGVVTSLMRRRFSLIFFVIVLGMLSYYFKLRAYDLADASLVFPITRLSVLISTIGGITALKEKEEIFKKLLSVAIILVGAFVLSTSQ